MIFLKKSFFWKRLVMSGSSVSGDLQTFALRFGNRRPRNGNRAARLFFLIVFL